MTWLAVLLLLAPVVVLLAVMRNERRRSELRAATADLRVDQIGVRRELADGRVEEVDWSELTEIDIVLAGQGPHASSGGVMMLAGNTERGALVPLDRLESSGVMEMLPSLPGFDTRRLLEALEGRPPSTTVVWTRNDPPGTLGDVT
jgi:hypothetical protein